MSDCGGGCGKPTNRRGCCPIGLVEITLAEGVTRVVTTSDLKNPAHPGSTYDAIRFLGAEQTVVLPLPSSLDESYAIEVENRAVGQVVIAAGAVASPVTGAVVALQQFRTVEVSLEDEVQDAAVSTWTYRTRVRVTPEGVYRVPGFTGP